jgi:hypothetical protein
MKKLFFLFFVLFFLSFSSQIIAQEVNQLSIDVNVSELTDSWNEVSVISGLLFSAKTENCINASGQLEPRALVRIENTCDTKYILEWSFSEVWTLESGEDSTAVISRDAFISSDELLEGTCDLNSDYHSLLSLSLGNSDIIGSPVMKSFSLLNLKILVYENH